MTEKLSDAECLDRALALWREYQEATKDAYSKPDDDVDRSGRWQATWVAFCEFMSEASDGN
jgi:hypothetical protein